MKEDRLNPWISKIKLNLDFAAGSLSIIDCKKLFINFGVATVD